MELQQQQQQLISMEGIENSNFRALLTKLINVMLSLLAVVLIFVSTVASMLGPFLTTRLVLFTGTSLACWSPLRSVKVQLVNRQGIVSSSLHKRPTQRNWPCYQTLAVMFQFDVCIFFRLRILTTVCMIAALVAVWQNWSVCQDLSHRLLEQYRRYVPVK